MWFAFLMRILRKRIVLAIIFILSLTYCILSFWQEGISDISSNDADSDLYARKLSSSFLWHSNNESNVDNVKVITCRNSVQGKVLIVDDRGYICPRSDVLPTGCCNTESENTKHFACDTCKSTGCCSIYEYCISCCLHPDKKHLLQAVLGKASENVLFASVTDHFELCLAKCRTSSQSVHHENSYRDPKAKHCYGEIPKIESGREPCGSESTTSSIEKCSPAVACPKMGTSNQFIGCLLIKVISDLWMKQISQEGYWVIKKVSIVSHTHFTYDHFEQNSVKFYSPNHIYNAMREFPLMNCKTVEH